MNHSKSRQTAWRLTSWRRIHSVIVKRRRGPGKTPGPAVADDVVDRDLTADGPNQLWLTHITEDNTGEGTLYACGVRHVFSNRIVGYSISHRVTAKLAIDAISNAAARRRDVAECVVHADRGSQFRSKAFQDTLTRYDLILSMGRVASAADNAAMESFHSLLQGNVLNRRTWKTRDELRLASVNWAQTKYHRRRRQDRLGRLTPIEYEAKATTETGHAAWTRHVTKTCIRPYVPSLLARIS